MPACEIQRSAFLFIACVLVSQSLGCNNPLDPPVVGGPCTYSDFVGTATVTELQPQDEGYWMVFDTQLMGEQPAKFRPEGRRVLIKNVGGKTDEAWLSAQGVRVGSKLDVKVAIITSGTCTPVMFQFPTLPAGSVHD